MFIWATKLKKKKISSKRKKLEGLVVVRLKTITRNQDMSINLKTKILNTMHFTRNDIWNEYYNTERQTSH